MMDLQDVKLIPISKEKKTCVTYTNCLLTDYILFHYSPGYLQEGTHKS